MQSLETPEIPPTDSPRIGLLLVHGIGAQKSGETTAQFVKGFLKAFPDAVFDQNTKTLQVEGRLVNLYEVYWADLLTDKKIEGTFNKDVVNLVAWFPWIHYRAGNYAAGDYSLPLVLARTLMLVPVGIVFQLIYQGARFLALSIQEIVESNRKGDGTPDRPESGKPEQSLFGSIQKKATETARSTAQQKTIVDAMLDEYAGDVFNYVNSAGGALQTDSPLVETAHEIHTLFYRAFKRASDDGCSEIQIISHNLGTVVMHLALSGHNLLDHHEQVDDNQSFEPLAKLTRVYTIGSPLEKIRFIWPKLITTDLVARVRFLEERVEVVSRATFQAGGYRWKWDNFYDPFDSVSGKLKRFQHWGGVTNHRLLGLGGPLRSHINYHSSGDFLSIVGEGLFGKRSVVRNSFLSRVKNLLLSAGENLLVLVAVPLTFLLGLAMVLLISGGLAYVLGMLLNLVGVPERTINIVKDSTMVALSLMFAISIVLAGRVRAGEAERQYWSLRPAAEPEEKASDHPPRS